MDPSGKVALVTGGASGIGLASVKELLKNGAKVAICDVNVTAGEEAIKEFTEEFGKDRVIFIPTDVTNEVQFEKAFNTTINRFKGLDIVFNNAGIIDDAHWDREIDINVKGVIRGTMLALKYMGKDQGKNGGVIINMSSVGGLDCTPLLSVYSGTKYAVVGFSRSLGMPDHYKRTGVRILTICPSSTDTTILDNTHNNLLIPEQKADFLKFMKALTREVKPEAVGKSLLHIIRNGESASVWVSEGKETYSISFPSREERRIHV